MLGAPVPRAMATSWKAVRQRFSVGTLGTGCVAMLWEHLLEEKTVLDVDVAALKQTMSSTWYPGQELNQGIQVLSILQSLTVGKAFNHSLDGIQLPSSLQSLTFGFEFNQSLDGIQLASSLQGLTFGSLFNRSLEGIQLPCSLQSLTFGSLFNQSIEGLNFQRQLSSRASPSRTVAHRAKTRQTTMSRRKAYFT